MKTSFNSRRGETIPRLVLPLILCAVTAFGQTGELDVRKPDLDSEGRFHVYSRVTGVGALPFNPGGFMPAEAGDFMTLNLTSSVNPFPEGEEDGEPAQCAEVNLKWAAPYWAGAAWISGPDGWWSETNEGWYYDLSDLKKKKLVFHARGDTGTERIQIKVGILGDKPFGDSIGFPVALKWLSLNTEWKRFELDLSSLSAKQLKRVANGFTFVLNKAQQGPGTKSTRFFLDAIYFE